MTSRRIATRAVALLLVALAAGPAAAAAEAKPAKRVVALEWEYVENLLALGVKPVGAADLRGMREWTAVSPPRGIRDVGTRQEPSLERIAALEPDLIVAPRFRTARNLRQLERIAPVMRLDAYPTKGGRDAQYKAMLTGIRRVAGRVGRRARGQAVIRDLDRTYVSLATSLRRSGLDGTAVSLAMAGGTAAAPAARLFTDNSLSAGVLRRLGLRNGANAASAPFGFLTVGVEAFSRIDQDGYLVFAYPEQYSDQVESWQEQDAWQELPIVRARRVRTIDGNSWPYGGPQSTKVLAQRITAALLQR